MTERFVKPPCLTMLPTPTVYDFFPNRCLVERILNISLVPFNQEPELRMRRLYHLYSNIDEKAVK